MNWQGLAGLTLGHDGASGLRLSEAEHQALRKYSDALADFGGQYCPDSTGIRGWTFHPEAVIEHSTALATAIRTVMSRLRAA